MPEPRDIPLVRWGEELRRGRRTRRLTRLTILLTAVAASAATAVVATLVPQLPLLVGNGGASSPLGVQRVEAWAELRAGEGAVTRVPPAANGLADKRSDLPANLSLVERVGDVAGYCACAPRAAVLVKGLLAAARCSQAVSGSMMGTRTGRRGLTPGELLLPPRERAQAFKGGTIAAASGPFGVKEDWVGRGIKARHADGASDARSA